MDATITKLSSATTIAQYRQFEKDRNQQAIAAMIQQRFTERYITPLRGERTKKHGFSLMAVSCLMIEALYSFQAGWKNSQGRSEKAFEEFFNKNTEFAIFIPIASSFYKNIRCGILHQAETTNGWRILRKGILLDPQARIINATKFHNTLEQCLIRYCKSLETEPWNAEVWKKCRKKLRAICKNCEYTP